MELNELLEILGALEDAEETMRLYSAPEQIKGIVGLVLEQIKEKLEENDAN